MGFAAAADEPGTTAEKRRQRRGGGGIARSSPGQARGVGPLTVRRCSLFGGGESAGPRVDRCLFACQGGLLR